MDIFKQHEIFEIEVLDRMRSARLLEPLVFGGGTMLRLCYELNRYSVDLDFWFIKKIPQSGYYDRLRQTFEQDYEITDAQTNRYSLLVELRSASYPKRLKIEIRREIKDCDYQETIAFSSFATKQVALKAHTLDQTMLNKVNAFLDRNEIRDCFDMEFLLRRGVALPADIAKKASRLLEKIDSFKDRDFKVKLGSIIEAEAREYYVTQRFSYLKERLSSAISNTRT
ncbi:MAG: nucleotidyl transferase AbiEii/AbiGii toxin family protein [Deltaproteobacteria bacterium]|jgi:predicted nucleotidyltransferase component of viral defense system|nr:nucleotidyl transferase AbiEii/AbiGii toxin family protein [Deltaproteobacteria bacterium]